MWRREAVFTQLQCEEVTQINAIRCIHFKVTIRLQLQKVTIHMSFIPVASCSLQNCLEIFNSPQCVLGFSPGSGQLATPRKPPRKGKSTGFSRCKERQLSAQYEKCWSSQITYCCSQCSRRGHAPVKPKEHCPKIAKDATLMSQSWKLSGSHLHRLHPVHKKTQTGEATRRTLVGVHCPRWTCLI